MLSTMFDDVFKHTEHLVQQIVENMLKQMLKPFKQALYTCASSSHLRPEADNQTFREKF